MTSELTKISTYGDINVYTTVSELTGRYVRVYKTPLTNANISLLKSESEYLTSKYSTDSNTIHIIETLDTKQDLEIITEHIASNKVDLTEQNCLDTIELIDTHFNWYKNNNLPLGKGSFMLRNGKVIFCGYHFRDNIALSDTIDLQTKEELVRFVLGSFYSLVVERVLEKEGLVGAIKVIQNTTGGLNEQKHLIKENFKLTNEHLTHTDKVYKRIMLGIIGLIASFAIILVILLTFFSQEDKAYKLLLSKQEYIEAIHTQPERIEAYIEYIKQEPTDETLSIVDTKKIALSKKERMKLDKAVFSKILFSQKGDLKERLLLAKPFIDDYAELSENKNNGLYLISDYILFNRNKKLAKEIVIELLKSTKGKEKKFMTEVRDYIGK